MPAPWLENIEATGPAFSCASVDAGHKECVWQHALHGRRRHDVAALPCKHATWGRRCPAVPGPFLGWWRMYMRHAYLAIVVLACVSMPVAFASGGPSCRPAVVWKCVTCLPIALPVLRHFACRSVRPRPAAQLPRAACTRLGNSAETPVALACCCDLCPLSGIMMVLFCGLCGLYAICCEIRASKLAIIVM